MNIPRVAFFADSFYEVNGVARTSREFARFAQERGYPFFSVHTGPETRHNIANNFETYEIQNSRVLLRLETDLSFDLLFLRHRARLTDALIRFQPDLIHITGPSHCGCLGAMIAYQLGIPLVASWHTNLHEYAARRLKGLLRWLPASWREHSAHLAERLSLWITLQFYRLARLLFAPNPELIDLLSTRTQRPTYPMYRGIDASLFSPERRTRSGTEFVIGYVGRLSAEKNVRMLAALEQALIASGLRNYKFLIVGDGGERAWLAANMHQCDLTGVLMGTKLAEAYANMDVFVFPSTTDTFGNVILEAMASGVPAIVSAHGGPKFLVESGLTGFVAKDIAEYALYIQALYENSDLRREMSLRARSAASRFSWASVFEGVYQTYENAIASGLLSRSARRSPVTAVISSVA